MTLSEFLEKHHANILECWFAEASNAASARGLARPEFSNLMPEYLRSLAGAGMSLGRFGDEPRKYLESHLAARIRQGFNVAEIVQELVLLGLCVQQLAAAAAPDAGPSPLDLEALQAELHLASAAVTDMFSKHLIEDEQAEKLFIRLIESVAREALQSGSPPLSERLRDVLALIMEAAGAQSVALLLHDSGTGELATAAAVGIAGLEAFALSRDLSVFAKGDARGGAPMSPHDISTIGMEVPDSLRQHGIHSLLGMRLPTGHRLQGVMYVGLSEARPFTAREVRRLEALGERLILHLDNAMLFADLREKIDALEVERDLRERFVSILAHDLRGPLATAKMSAERLISRPEKLDERRELAIKIDRNIERTDSMICDLLDVSRMHAGQRLTIRLEECDLGAIARDVVDEMSALHGNRFTLQTDHRARGIWSASELRRALWNLVSNAVKYGASERPISISIRRRDGWVEAAVHNDGAPISPQDQARLFHPFSRARAVQVAGPRGWGLGLALVHGCAEHHGGRVRLQSDAATGTTFTLELPLDARPYQSHAEGAAAAP